MPRRGPRLLGRAPGRPLTQRSPTSSRRLSRSRPRRRSHLVRSPRRPLPALESSESSLDVNASESGLRGLRERGSANSAERRPPPAGGLSAYAEKARSKGPLEPSARWSSGVPEPRIHGDCEPFRGSLPTALLSTSKRGRAVDLGVDSNGSARGTCGRSTWTSSRSSTASFHRPEMFWIAVDERAPAHGSSTGRGVSPTADASTEALHHTTVGAHDLAFIHNSTCPLLRRRIL